MAAGTRRTSTNILWGILGLALTFLAVARITNRPPTSVRGPLKILTPPFTANKAEIIRELRDRKFQDLDTQLNSYQKGFEENVLEEGNLSIAFEAFSFTDPALSSPLDEWVKSDPNSYQAHLARAEYLIALGGQARGNRYANKTTEQQFSEMNRLFVEGVKETVAAIKLNPKASIAYSLIIQAAKAGSDGNTLERVYAAGLKNIPLSLSIRVSVINALEPRWGGSHEAMAKFAADAQKYAAQNPRLVSLKGFADEDKGNIASGDGDPKKAIGLYNQALQEGGDFARAYQSRGRTYDELHRYDDALEDLSRANRLRPQDPDILETMAYVYGHLNRPKNTLALIQEYRQFAEPNSDLVNLEQWANNFGAGAAPAVKTGGN
jgi:tetratricopeptide (TPR) repeat protein